MESKWTRLGAVALAAEERRVLELFRRLTPAGQALALEFAEQLRQPR